MKKYIQIALVVIISAMSSTQLLAAQDTYLLSLTHGGGANGEGAIVSYNLTTNTEQVLWSFGGTGDGYQPWGSLTYYPGNNLYYGMTQYGGATNNGVIFSFDPATDSEKVVYSFAGGSDAAQPLGDLVYQPSAGLFYALTYLGGSSDSGAIISFDPSTNTEALLYSFHGETADGSLPGADMTYDATTGFFYGMTGQGGPETKGVIFKFDPVASVETVIHDFGTGNDQGQAYGGFAYDPANSLYYGMTQIGGSSDRGAIIDFNPTGNVESIAYSFGAIPDGAYPSGTLVYDTARALLYGVIASGGSGNNGGAIISFNPVTNTDSVLWAFGTGTDGNYPSEALVYDVATGLYYGETSNGGTNSNGVIFSFNPATSAETVLYNFGTGTDASHPYGAPILYSGYPTGINPVTAASSVGIYPNPTSGMINITGLSTGQSINIYDYLGEKVSSNTATAATQSIDISAQQSGMYLVQILNKDGSIASEKKVVRGN